MATVTFVDEINNNISVECRIVIRVKREIRLERATKTVAMAENRPWSTKRKTKARSARLAAAQMSRVTAERTQKLHSGQTTGVIEPCFRFCDGKT